MTNPSTIGVSFPERLAVIRELLETLEGMTRSGQPHVMRKVLGLLRLEVLRSGLPLTRSERAMVNAAVGNLEREVERIAPAPGVFNGHAHIVVEVLSNLARDRGREQAAVVEVAVAPSLSAR
jgi:hypothetical protein